MGNTYTPNFFFRKPDIGDYDWADEFWQNQDIKDMLLASLYSDNYVHSNLDFHISSVFEVQWTEGIVFINDIQINVSAGVLTLPPGSPSYRVPTFLYVDDTGTVNYSTTPIDLTDKVCVAVCDVADSDIKLIAHTKRPIPKEEINNVFYVSTAGDDSAAGSSAEPWGTLRGAIQNLAAKNFSHLISTVTLRLTLGVHLHDIDEGCDIPSFLFNVVIEGESAIQGEVEMNMNVTTNPNSHVFKIENSSFSIYFKHITFNLYSPSMFIISNNSSLFSMENCFIDGAAGLFDFENGQGKLLNVTLSNFSGDIFNLKFKSFVSTHNLSVKDCFSFCLINGMSMLVCSSLFVSFTSILTLNETYITIQDNSQCSIDDSTLNCVNNIGETTSIAAGGQSIVNIRNVSFLNQAPGIAAYGASYFTLVPGTTGYGTLSPPANTVGNDNSYIKA